MNMLVVDSQGVLNKPQLREATDRLQYSLARFAHRLNAASMHLSVSENCEKVSCQIDVNVEGSGVLSVQRSSRSSMEAMNLALDAVESKVALRVDWRSWFNAETFATWINSLGLPWQSLSEVQTRDAGRLRPFSSRRRRRRKTKPARRFVANSPQANNFST